MKFFKESEFQCGCGCGFDIDDMDYEMLLKLDKARGYANVPFTISSSIRCKKHNKKEGGSPTSSHLIGEAVDIKCLLAYNRFKIITGLIQAGFNRIGIHHKFIHADTDINKPKELCWIY